MEFIGRKEELRQLKELTTKQGASLIVIKGRRRIGKSRLAEEFSKGYRFFSFTGLPITPETTAQSQREVFAKQLDKAFSIHSYHSDWWDILLTLSEKTKKGKVIILFDEISWMGSKDPDFLGKLKTVWDNHFKKNPNLIFILCGSISSWIEKNILSSTGFMGRLSLILTLKELPLQDCDLFWRNHGDISAFEKLKVLSVTGGIPRYLEEIRPHLSAEQMLQQWCFTSSGILFHEFDQIFSDLFSTRNTIYRKIVTLLAEKNLERNDIAKALNIEVGGAISQYLDDLVQAGFIARDFSWRVSDGKTSNLSFYRLSDNYLRFYLKYIFPNKRKIEAGTFKNKSITSLPGWSAIMGLQFENLVLNQCQMIHHILGIRSEDVISEGKYFQRSTLRQEGCQIDYLIQTKYNALYICEIKFSKESIGKDVISEVSEKVKRLKKPKNMSLRTVLIHVNGVKAEVAESDYFSYIICFDQFFTG
jgi:uncharacterized protein